MVKFQLNIDLDKKMAGEFLDFSLGGYNFGKIICEDHPGLKNKTGKDKEFISNYFDDFYAKNKVILLARKDYFQTNWQNVETEFLNLANKLFDGHFFPKGKYIGYISSFCCNPRFLNDKTFQVYYLNEDKGTVAHEMLHFIFYDYVQTKMPELVLNLDTNTGLFWDVAEIFNSVILSSDLKFVDLLGKNDWCYPDHRLILPRAKEFYFQNLPINIFIKKLFELANEISNKKS